MDLQNKILDVIKENLSQAQVGLLRDYFTQAEKDNAELKTLRTRNEALEKEVSKLRVDNDKLSKEQIEVQTLGEKYKKDLAQLEKDRIGFDLSVEKEKLKACQASYAEMKDLIGMVFRNPRFIHEQRHDEHHEGYQHANGWVNSHDVRKTYTTKTEQE